MSDKKFYVRTSCRLCASKSLRLAIPMHPIPIISPNVGETSSNMKALLSETAPLDVYRCEDCGLLQLTTVLDPHLQYDTFMYETSVSLGLREHFGQFVDSFDIDRTQSVNVLEIGSNDGTLLEFFQQKGANVLGVDPAKRIAEDATQRGIPTLANFFTRKLAQQIVNKHGKMNVVISNNTMANLDDLSDMVLGVKDCLAPDGVFVVETQYALDVLDKLLLDVIYHEHLNYFAIKPLHKFYASLGLQIINVERIWPKGGSIRVYAQLIGGNRKVDKSVDELIALEEARGLYKQHLYQDFSKCIQQISDHINNAIDVAQKAQREIAAYGASVGCVSLINQFNIADKIQFIVDDTPFKKHLMGPNYKLEIVSRDELLHRNPALVIMLAWRYAESICAKNEVYLQNGGKFLIPFPEVKFIKYNSPTKKVAVAT